MARSRLLDQVRDTLRVKHYSIRTEESYIQWIKRFIYFHNKKHPVDMSGAEITAIPGTVYLFLFSDKDLVLK